MRLIIFLFIALQANNIYSQAQKNNYDIGFSSSKKDTVQRNTNEDKLWNAEIIASNNTGETFKDYIIDVTVNEDKSTLPKKDYEIIATLNSKSLKDLKSKGNLIRLVIKQDDASDKQEKTLKLFLTIKIKNDEKNDDDASNNDNKITEVELDILPTESPISSYKILGYLGTNFDLVDGVQAKNLFFATNIFIADSKKWGFSLGIYGNRTMTKTDTARNTSFTSKIISIGRDSIGYYRDTAMKVTSYVSDNIGANFSPLIPLKFFSDGDIKVYYAPQFEFIWRRTKIENTFLNNSTTKIDTAENRFPAGVALPLITPLTSKSNLNIYDAYLGLVGLLLRYETDEISIRATSSFGINFNYVPTGPLSNDQNLAVNAIFQKQTRLFFFGRLWITEPSTGLTLGAELSNFFGSKTINGVNVSKAQPYYNVTLSKAFNLRNLAAIVKPLTQR
jgi:hypothetical protein